MKQFCDSRRTSATRAVLFLVPTGILLLYEYIRLGRIGNITADGRLYLSIADHFLTTGHFIQNARWFSGLVVPPGVPLVLLLFRALGFTESVFTWLHACLFGGSCLALGETEKRLHGSYGIAPAVYLLGYVRCRLLLGNILVEHYYLFLLCVLLYSLICAESPRKLMWMNIVGVALLMTRPAMAPIYLAIIAYTLVVSLKKRKTGAFVAALLLPVLLLSLNLWNNYRETGEYILLESYSGTDLYITASANAPVTFQDSLNYVDETRERVYNDTKLTMSQKSRILGGMARGYIRDHPGEYVLKASRRFIELFLKSYCYLTLLPVAGAILLIHQMQNQKKLLHFFLFGMNCFLAMMTSFGIPEIRYTAVIWPLAALHISVLAHLSINRLKQQTEGRDG